MQEIELDGSPSDLNWVLSIMFFPNDARLREQQFTSNEIDAQCTELQDDFKVNVDVKTLKLLLSAPSKEELKRKTVEATKKAVVAGDILAMIYLMDKFKKDFPEFGRPSLRKAMDFACQFGLKAWYGDGTKPPYSLKKIRACWDEYKPVAHLWAAQRISQDYAINEGTNFESVEALNKFLGVAKGIFQFGCSFVPLAAKQKLPILDRQSSWIIPNHINSLSLENGQVPERLLEYAKKYISKC
jgi:hypothetical protein